MVDLPALATAIATKDGILAAIYSDLAQPGVRQVGKALETVLQTGNALLLPVRLLNETARKFEELAFGQIADRFSKIPESRIVDVTPEVGAPILDRLSITSDPLLRSLFVELLAKAADAQYASLAHPSFVKVIENLSPDEAMLLRDWTGQVRLPLIEINRKVGEDSISPVESFFIDPPEGLLNPDMCPVYVSNLSGLGLIKVATDKWLSNDTYYDGVVGRARKMFPSIKDNTKFESQSEIINGDYIYQKAVIDILPLGSAFQKACLEESAGVD